MLRLLSAAACGLAAFFVLIQPSAAQSCVTSAMLNETLSQNIQGADLRMLEKGPAQAFVTAFNAVPPRSDVAADAVLLARHAKAPQAVTIFFWKDCMTGRAILPTDVLDRLLASIETEA